MHLCLDADFILLQYEILEGHTQLTHLHLCSHPFVDSASASGEVLTSTPIWMELLDGLERLRTKKGKNPSSKVVK